MKNKPQDLLKQLMFKPETMSMEHMDKLVKSSLQFFNEFIEVSKSGDKENQEKALKELLEFKDVLQNLSQKVSEETGLSPKDLMEFSANPANFSKEQWETMKEINESIAEFNTSVISNQLPDTKKALKKAGKAARRQSIAI